MKIAALLVFTAATALAADHASAPYFSVLDRNHDGLIRPDEVEQNPWTKRLDKDGSGSVAPEEFAAGWDQFPALRAGLVKMFPEAGASSTPKPANEALASPRQAARILAPADHQIGTFIPDATLLTLDGQPRALSTFAKDQPLVI